MKKVLIIVGLVFLFVFAAAASYFYGVYNNMVVAGEVQETQVVIVVTPTSTPDPLAPKNVLVLGYGGAGHDGGLLTDTMILVNVDPREKQVVLISIPRDLWVPLPYEDGSSEEGKINNAYAIGSDDEKYPNKVSNYSGKMGGANLAKYAVEYATGMPVDYFISINFNGFKNIIDILDGVEVNVPYAFDDYYYPIKGEEDNPCDKTDEEIEAITATMSGELLEKQFPCRYEHLHFDKGVQTLDSENALKFVRSRHSNVNGSDFGRSLRQQALIVAIKDEILSLKTLTKIIPLVNEISKNVQTDIDIKSAVSLTQSSGGVADVEVHTVSLNTDNVFKESISWDNQYILIPINESWNEVGEYLQREIDEFKEEALKTPIP